MAQDQIIQPCRMVMIGGSAGSLEIVMSILATVHSNAPYTFAIILHRKASADSSLVYVLSDKTTWPVKEVEDKDSILPRHVYVAPGDYHLLVEKDGNFSLDLSEKINYSRPSIDAAFESAADVYGETLTAILLSGANADGAKGMLAVKERGGTCIVQHPRSAEVEFMPREAIAQVAIDYIVDGKEIGAFLNRLAGF